jgi:hypothetical protein
VTGREIDRDTQRETEKRREEKRREEKRGIPMKLDLATMDLARLLEQPAFHDSGSDR